MNKHSLSNELTYYVFTLPLYSHLLCCADVFKFDAEYEQNEEKYKELKRDILDEGSSDSDGDGGSDSDSSDDSDDDDAEKKGKLSS